MLEAGLVAARFFHYAAAMALFGLALFPLYTFSSSAGEPPALFGRWLRIVAWVAIVAALLSAIAWGLFTVAIMAGALSGAADGDVLWAVLETGFGQVWLTRLGLAVALAVLLATRDVSGRRANWVIMLGAAGLLATLAGVGHTQVDDGAARIIHVSADGAHLLAAGAWLGGLLALGYLLKSAGRSAEDTANASTALVRFSGMGYLAVAVLVGSGLINTWFLVGSPHKLATTSYGQLLMVKLLLFAGMLVLAGLNRLRLVPSLVRAQNSRQAALPLRSLRQHVLGEQALGLATVLIVSFLGTLQPAIASA